MCIYRKIEGTEELYRERWGSFPPDEMQSIAKRLRQCGTWEEAVAYLDDKIRTQPPRLVPIKLYKRLTPMGKLNRLARLKLEIGDASALPLKERDCGDL